MKVTAGEAMIVEMLKAIYLLTLAQGIEDEEQRELLASKSADIYANVIKEPYETS